jgi:hypothetical protein
MKKILILLLAAVLVMSTTAIAALIDFNRVTTYADNTAIPVAKVPTIKYRGYYGPSLSGPWVSGNVVVDNQAIPAPDPFPGETLWYTVDATLDNVTSAKAVAASKTAPFPDPAAPALRGVR